MAKVPAMIADNGGELREWRRSRGWDVPELARRLRRAADEPVAAHEGLVRMIRAWERGDHHPSERYELLYRRLGLPPRDKNEPEPTDTGNQEGTRPVRRRTFVELTGISLAGALLPGATGTSPATGIESLVLMLTGASPESSATPPDLRGLTLSVTRASQLDTARRCLDGDNRRRACALSADAYHVAAGVPARDRRPGPGPRRHRPEHDRCAGQPGSPDGRRERPDPHPHPDQLGSPGRRRHHGARARRAA